MLKKRLTKISNALKKLLKSGKDTKKYILCKECDEVEVEVAQDIKAVTCAYCVQRQVAPPESVKPKSNGEKFPRGWALKTKYVHTDGRVFEKGKETGEIITPTVKVVKPKKEKITKKKVVKKKISKRKK